MIAINLNEQQEKGMKYFFEWVNKEDRKQVVRDITRIIATWRVMDGDETKALDQVHVDDLLFDLNAMSDFIDIFEAPNSAPEVV
ncbi:MAG TPA: hypothetical protein VIH86_00480 [Puia sp.]